MRWSTDEILERHETCPVTGLPVVRRAAWVEIRLHDDYRVSFFFLGERILVTRPVGRSPSLDIDAFYAARDAVLAERLGSVRDFVEIKDYSGLRGAPTRAQRNLQTRKFYDDIGRSLGFFPYDLRAVQEPLFRVALLLHSPVYPFALKRGYADAALAAAQLVRLFELRRLRSGDPLSGAPGHQRHTGRWSGEARVLADALLYLRLSGDLRADDAEDWIVNVEEELLASRRLGARAPYDKIIDLSALSPGGWRYGGHLFARLSELHLRHAAPRSVYLVNPTPAVQRAAALISPLYPHPLRTVPSLADALQAVEIVEEDTAQRMIEARSLAPAAADGAPATRVAARALSLLRRLPARLRRTPPALTERYGIVRPTGAASRRQIEELIRSACHVMWEAPVGDELPTVAADHPLREVYDAFSVMQREIRQLFTAQRDKAAELQQAKQQLERANRELNQALARSHRLAGEARQAARAKGIFLASMSHEIRTPLNAVLAPLEMLSAAPLPGELAQLAALAREGAQTLLCLVDDILDFSKLEAGKVQLEAADFSVAELLAEVCRLMAVTARAKGIALRYESALDKAADWVHADRGRLRQVLLNLVSNAIKFTEAGSVELRVDRGADRDPPRPDDTRALAAPAARAAALPAGLAPEPPSAPVRFTVRDTGVGLSGANVDELFEPFTQADTTPRQPVAGTGLGLAICRELVTLMGGELGAEPNPEQGATFWLELPLAPARGPWPADPAEREQAEPPPHAAGHRVLVVEDDATSRHMLLLLLRRLGFEVTAVADGEAACAAIEREAPDLVLMDCQLPVMDGYATTRAIRRREEQARAGAATAPSRLPIIALTAHTSGEDRARCFAAGMDDYLAKPVGFAELLGALRRWFPGAAPAS